MPISRYDPKFGGKGSAAKALKKMIERYGSKRGRSVFYATVNKRDRR
jgi:RimJ/RimL family protein N-acetyltransferase